MSIFLSRYNGERGKDLFHFEARRLRGGCTATLVARGFHDRRFEGFGQGASEILAKRSAELAACQTFKLDHDVNEVRPWLPPSLQQIRKFFSLSKAQKEELTALGADPKTVQSDIVNSIYNGFRDLGCRTELWDALDGRYQKKGCG